MIVFTTILLSYNNENAAFAQDSDEDKILMRVANEDITKGEFLKVYYKNSKKDKEIDQKSLDEYLQLYINFKLKVAEAVELGLDTTKAFITELSGYRAQLAQPYLNDKNISEALMQEAYERKQFDVRASHILIKVGMDADPRDTLVAYRKIVKLRRRILNGEDFSKVAMLTSEDPSAKDNGGDLGYFTVFQMIYPFETKAYTTEVGKISTPVRTRYGYHLIKVVDKREALGEVKTSHIMVITKKEAEPEDLSIAKVKIDGAYAELETGVSFSDVVRKYSEDKKTKVNGGALPWFTTGKMVGDFEMAVASLTQKGAYTKPVKTPYGWHIIQLNDKKKVPEFNQIKGELKSRIAKDARSNKPRQAFVAKVKKEYAFKQNIRNRNKFYAVVDDSYFRGRWDIAKAKSLTGPLFTIGDRNYTQIDFAKYIQKHPTKSKKKAVRPAVNRLYVDFVQESCISYADSKLESKYPDFKSLVQEYHDGILLFELTDQKVWSKAIKDTSGLKVFYSNNKNNYMWGRRLHAEVYTCDDAATVKMVRKLLKKKAKKGYTIEYITKTVNEDKKVLNVTTQKYLENEDELINSIKWVPGLTEDKQVSGKIVIVNVLEVLNPTPKTLMESKGLVTADYQSYLEKEWIETLKKKYTIEIFKEVLSSIR